MNGKRGRKPTFTEPQRTQLAELIREHGISGAQKLSGVSICHVTLVKIAKAYCIRLKAGRRRQQLSIETATGVVVIRLKPGWQPEDALRDALATIAAPSKAA